MERAAAIIASPATGRTTVALPKSVVLWTTSTAIDARTSPRQQATAQFAKRPGTNACTLTRGLCQSMTLRSGSTSRLEIAVLNSAQSTSMKLHIEKRRGSLVGIANEDNVPPAPTTIQLQDCRRAMSLDPFP